MRDALASLFAPPCVYWLVELLAFGWFCAEWTRAREVRSLKADATEAREQAQSWYDRYRARVAEPVAAPRPMSCTETRRPLYDFHDGPAFWFDVDAIRTVDDSPDAGALP